MKALTEKMPDAKIHDGVRLLIAPFYANLEVKRSMNADLTDGRCRVVGTRQLLKKLASDEISVLYVAKDAQREITEKLTALAEGNRVKVTVRFRGREVTHSSLGQDLLHRFAELCSECSTVEKQPKLEGRQMLMFLAPAKDK